MQRTSVQDLINFSNNAVPMTPPMPKRASHYIQYDNPPSEEQMPEQMMQQAPPQPQVQLPTYNQVRYEDPQPSSNNNCETREVYLSIIMLLGLCLIFALHKISSMKSR